MAQGKYRQNARLSPIHRGAYATNASLPVVVINPTPGVLLAVLGPSYALTTGDDTTARRRVTVSSLQPRSTLDYSICRFLESRNRVGGLCAYVCLEHANGYAETTVQHMYQHLHAGGGGEVVEEEPTVGVSLERDVFGAPPHGRALA